MEETVCSKRCGPVYDISGMTLHSLVEDAAARYADNNSVIFDDGTTQSRLTYSQLWALVLKVEQGLSPFASKGEVISLCLKVDGRMPAVLIGIQKMGAAFYNFDAKNCSFAAEVMSRLGSRILLVHSDFQKMVTEQLEMKEVQYEQHAVEDNDFHNLRVVVMMEREKKCYDGGLAYCITTSGTTGRPKVVHVPHSCITPNILHLWEIFNLTPADVVLCATPLTFDPVMVEIFTALSSGACLVVVSPDVKMNPQLLLDIIVRNKVTVMQVTPTLLYCGNLASLLGNNSCLRVLALGGEQFPSPDWLAKNRWSKNRTQLINLYGVTEVSCWAMYYELTEEDIRERRTIPLGKPLSNTEVEIVSIQETCGKKYGQICIYGQGRQCFIDEDVHKKFCPLSNRGINTGDFVEIKGGNWYFCGRQDSQLKRNGQRINLQEIKNVALGYTNMMSSEVLYIKRWQKIVVVAKLHDGCHDNTSQAILTFMHHQLPSYSWPDDVHIVQEIPITVHGKSDMRLLEKLYCTLKTKKLDNAELAYYLASAWMDLLKVDEYDLISSNFVADGGDSIKAVQLTNEIEAKLQLRLPFLMDILINQTFEQVKQYVIAAARNRGIALCGFETSAALGFYKNVNIKLPGNEYIRLYNAGNMGSLNSSSGLVTDAYVSTESGKDFIRSFKDNMSEIRDLVELDATDVVVNKMEYSNVSPVKTAHSVGNAHADNLRVVATEDIETVTKKRKKLTENDKGDKFTMENDFLNVNDMNKDFSLQSAKNSNTNGAEKSSVSKLEGENKNGVKRTKFTEPFYFSVIGGNKCHFLQPARGLRVNDIRIQKLFRDICPESDDCEELPALEVKNVSVQLELVWKHNMKKCVDACPVIAVGEHRSVVYVGSHSYMFSAIDLHTGTVLWSLTFPYRIMERAAVSVCGTKIVVCCVDGYVYVLDAHCGTISWQFNTGSALQCAPAVDNVSGYVFVRNFNDVYFCLDVMEYRDVWRVSIPDLPGKTSADVSCCPHHVYYTSSRHGVVFPLNPDTGQVLWQYKIGLPVLVSPVVTSCGVLVACTDGHLYHVSHDGKLIWKSSVGNYGRITSPSSFGIQTIDALDFARANDRIPSKLFFGTQNDIFESDSAIGAMSVESGCIETSKLTPFGIQTSVFPYTLHIECAWKEIADTKYTQRGNPTKQNQHILNDKKYFVNTVVFTDKHGVNIAHMSTFDVLCKVEGFQKEIWSSPVVFNNFVVFGCRDNHVYCYKISASRNEQRGSS